MGNKRNRRSRRLETPSPKREIGSTQVESPNSGKETLTNFNTFVQNSLGEDNPENQLIEPRQISNEIQARTEIFEQKNIDRFEKMREEMDNKFEANLREIRTNKNASTITNPSSEANEIQESQTSKSKTKSTGVHASNNKNSDSENDDFPLRASKMKDL